MNWWEEIALTVIVGLLKKTIKNPGSVKVEQSVIAEIATLSQDALKALGG